MSKTAKRLLRAGISLVVPILYTSATCLFPDLPISEETVIDIAVWGIGLTIGGWNIRNIFSKRGY